jgi:hypothetical protein
MRIAGHQSIAFCRSIPCHSATGKRHNADTLTSYYDICLSVLLIDTETFKADQTSRKKRAIRSLAQQPSQMVSPDSQTDLKRRPEQSRAAIVKGGEPADVDVVLGEVPEPQS